MCVPFAEFSSESLCFSISQVYMTPPYIYQQPFLNCYSSETPVALLRFCFEVYDVARLMKCWYSELAISKSSVIQGSVNISDMLAIYAWSGVHFLIILVVCYLIHSLDSTHVAFFTMRLVLRGFRFSSFQFQVFFWESIFCKLNWASLLSKSSREFDSCGWSGHFLSVSLINLIYYASTHRKKTGLAEG